jgi:hypothetical protein
MKRAIVIVVALLVAVGAAWYFLSPGYAMSQLRDAAVAGDAAELEERIDFPAVREALKADMRASMEGDAVLGGELAMKMVGGLIDAVITPQAMATVVKEGRLGARDPAAGERQQTEWEIDREGFGRFRATPVVDEGTPPSMIFELDGLGWRVVEIDIPENELAPGL